MAYKRGLVAAVAVALPLLTRPRRGRDLDRTSWRPTVIARNGMVSCGSPARGEAGVRILKAGDATAIDAAIATWAVQGEVEPGMTGLGADMFLVYYNAKTGAVSVINGTGFAPQAATIDFYRGHGGIPEDGALSVAVPGAVAGAALALERVRHEINGGRLRTGHRDRRARLPNQRDAGGGPREQPRRAREVPVHDEDLV